MVFKSNANTQPGFIKVTSLRLKPGKTSDINNIWFMYPFKLIMWQFLFNL
ncbi:hypothetical protein FH603_2481 [Spirosoma sp. LMG 31447]|uniref:Uncharacterized protein n=1 Tax=Spirosoma utsteinense TaxID=2585773 RepID=A0ABR6W675_9BACT|nr:hypothetical protein [Spirosoma utsteinense]